MLTEMEKNAFVTALASKIMPTLAKSFGNFGGAMSTMARGASQMGGYSGAGKALTGGALTRSKGVGKAMLKRGFGQLGQSKAAIGTLVGTGALISSTGGRRQY